MSDEELSLFIQLRCLQIGTVKSVKIHRQPKFFALLEMATDEESAKLAAQFGRTPIGTSALLPLKPEDKKN